MAHLIDKDALIAEIEKLIERAKAERVLYPKTILAAKNYLLIDDYKKLLSLLDTLEVKEIGISIPNIDDILEEDGIDPNSKTAKIFKESYYTALEKYKEKKGIV